MSKGKSFPVERPLIQHLEGIKWYQHNYNEVSEKLNENFEEFENSLKVIWKNEKEAFEKCMFLI